MTDIEKLLTYFSLRPSGCCDECNTHLAVVTAIRELQADNLRLKGMNADGTIAFNVVQLEFIASCEQIVKTREHARGLEDAKNAVQKFRDTLAFANDRQAMNAAIEAIEAITKEPTA